jgi:hypothetical protein
MDVEALLGPLPNNWRVEVATTLPSPGEIEVPKFSYANINKDWGHKATRDSRSSPQIGVLPRHQRFTAIQKHENIREYAGRSSTGIRGASETWCYLANIFIQVK